MTFTLAMVENPQIWCRAQLEIDAVVGMDRLPEFEDRPSLPYVEAIVRETLRWRPVSPIGAHLTVNLLFGCPKRPQVVHSVMSSDIYEGYYIPKGMSYTCVVLACE